MTEASKLVQDLERVRDEIKLKIHLGSKDLQDEWSEIEKRWDAFAARANLDRSARDLGEAASLLGSELKDAFNRIRKAL